MNEPNGVKASSAAGTVSWWASVEATIEVTHWPQPPKTGPLLLLQCIHTNMAFFPPMTKVKRHFVSCDAM